jgi:hypothetical protein
MFATTYKTKTQDLNKSGNFGEELAINSLRELLYQRHKYKEVPRCHNTDTLHSAYTE